jgi:hypothetical protein
LIVFDPRDQHSDRWQPLWGEQVSELVSRVLAGIQTSEPYYADALRQHVTLVARVRQEANYWPPSFRCLSRSRSCGALTASSRSRSR